MISSMVTNCLIQSDIFYRCWLYYVSKSQTYYLTHLTHTNNLGGGVCVGGGGGGGGGGTELITGLIDLWPEAAEDLQRLSSQYVLQMIR
jgi:hypothetical protein